jgi:hypothetical protein
MSIEHIPDYYAILGVDVDASTDAIKKAFKHLALHYHPDIYKGADAEQKMRDLLLAYQTLSDPERRRSYDLSRAVHMPGCTVRVKPSTDKSATADDARQRSYAFAFPPLPDGLPASLDLGEITYLLSAREARRLKEDGMLRGAKLASASGNYVCHRCHSRWQQATLPAACPHCHARDWREYLLLRCRHCQAVFESEQIRDEVGTLTYGNGRNDRLCPPYELFPLCPACGKAEWCPAEEERLWNVRDRAARIEKWRRRFGQR